MLKIVSIVGTRPQFVKAAAVSKCFKANDNIQEILLHTGQHYDENMSKIFFDELGIPKPDYHFEIESLSHGQQTGEMLKNIESVLIREKPKCVLVYGDTNSTLAGALASVKLNLPVVHVEAGLRSYNRNQPEEINRILTDQIADLLFAPSKTSLLNLQKEGISESLIRIVGDIMYDVAILFNQQCESSNHILQDLKLHSKEYLIVTIHRAENTEDINRLKKIFIEFSKLSDSYKIVVPLHPRTMKKLNQDPEFEKIKESLQLINPQSFFAMMCLVKNASLVITDSGGLQKEAFYHHVPCIVLRDETEWMELIDQGWNQLLPPSKVSELSQCIDHALKQENRVWDNPYGDGTTASKITNEILKKYL